MDKELAERLDRIEDAAGCISTGKEPIDLLEFRNELEAVAQRLSEHIESVEDTAHRIAGQLQTNATSLERLSERLNGIEGTLHDIYGEMPTSE